MPKEATEASLGQLARPDAKAFRLPQSASIAAATKWFDHNTPAGRDFDVWQWCGKRSDSLGTDLRWFRKDEFVPDTLSLTLSHGDGPVSILVSVVQRAINEARECATAVHRYLVRLD